MAFFLLFIRALNGPPSVVFFFLFFSPPLRGMLWGLPDPIPPLHGYEESKTAAASSIFSAFSGTKKEKDKQTDSLTLQVFFLDKHFFVFFHFTNKCTLLVPSSHLLDKTNVLSKKMLHFITTPAYEAT